ncbi:hypothetical protein [Halosegnis sp.]|uniref:hypothetical protein n=1 Tax=Halosegnis sp. TaxID=2864959 RepID=UPI0035D4ECFA
MRCGRRRLLAAVGTLVLGAGCGEPSAATQFRRRLRTGDIAVRALSETKDAWVLEYLTAASNTADLRGEARRVAVAYAATVPAGDHRLDATAVADAADALSAEWYAEGTWARAHAAGDLSTAAYLDRVAGTTDAF